MKNVYLWKVGDRVIFHTDLLAASQIDGLSRKPDKTVTEDEFSDAGGLVRLIDGKIYLGKTNQEIEDEKTRARIMEIDSRFAVIEGQLVRPLAAHIEGTQDEDDKKRLKELTAEARALRAERKEKKQSLSTPL